MLDGLLLKADRNQGATEGSTPERMRRIVSLTLNSRQPPKSAQTWLPKNSSSALDVVPKPYYCGISNHTSAPSLPRRSCLALHPCALPVHPPPPPRKHQRLPA